jgi:GAF domain-containing protein
MGANRAAATPTPQNDHYPEYLGFLQSATKGIKSSYDYITTMQNVAEAMVPQLADWCAVDIIQENGRLKRVAFADNDPERVKVTRKIVKDYPRRADAKSGTTFVVRTGEPEVNNNITDEMLVAVAHNKEHLELLRSLKFHAKMIFPIKSRGVILGTITFIWTDPTKNYGYADMAFAETLCAIAGSAIDQAQRSRKGTHKPA